MKLFIKPFYALILAPVFLFAACASKTTNTRAPGVYMTLAPTPLGNTLIEFETIRGELVRAAQDQKLEKANQVFEKLITKIKKMQDVHDRIGWYAYYGAMLASDAQTPPNDWLFDKAKKVFDLGVKDIKNNAAKKDRKELYNSLQQELQNSGFEKMIILPKL